MDVIFAEAEDHSKSTSKISVDINKLGAKLMDVVNGYTVTNNDFSTKARKHKREDEVDQNIV